MSKAICDFCSLPSVVWRYPARTFAAYVVANIGGESVGDWAACEQCHRLIEVDDRAGLTERSLVTLIAKHPEMEPARSELMEHMTSLHVMFFENRTGMALRIV
jgi:hypothetical protein